MFVFFGYYGDHASFVEERWKNNTNSGFLPFRWNFNIDEAGLLRNKFYDCRCVVAINAKVIYRLALKSGFQRDFLQSLGSTAWFCNQRFWWLWKKKFPEKIISLTIQTNIDLHNFEAKFLLKKKSFDKRCWFFFCPWNMVTERS